MGIFISYPLEIPKKRGKTLIDPSRFENLVIENLSDLKKIVGNQNKRFELLQAELYREFTLIRVDLAQQKIRSGLLGMVAGMIPVVIMIGVNYVDRSLK